jgi:hypothetical protein
MKGENSMKKRLILILVFTLLATLVTGVLVASAQDESDLVRLEISNKSGQSVSMSLLSDPYFYFLTVPADETMIFTVERSTYIHTTYSCDLTGSGVVAITSQMKLVFTACSGNAPNWGEPGHEKIHIDDSPDGLNWRFNFE